MEINIINNDQKDSWDNFVIENNGSFLQSFEWGEIQEKSGKKVFYVKSDDAMALVIKNKLPLKSYLYIPYGPCFKADSNLDDLFSKIKKIAKQEKSIFLRIEPYSSFDISIFRHIDISLVRIQPQKTLVLDIKGDEESILQSFPKATRYSIRQAEKHNLIAEFKDEYTPEFYQLMNKTSNRSKFTPHSEKYYKGFFDAVSTEFKVKMCLAKHKEKIISASMLVLFNKTATYLHAASDKSLNNMQAPTFLMWQQIKLAKAQGCETFDFWGIDEKKWPGVTHFKKSFGGKKVKYPQAANLVFQKGWYLCYQIIKKMNPVC